MVGVPLCWMTRSFKSVNRLLFTSLILLSISGVFPVLTNILVIGIFHIGCLNSNTYVSGSLCYYDLTLTNTSMYYHKSYMKFFSTLHNSIETQSLYVWTYRYYGILYLQYLKSRPIFMRGCKTEIQKILCYIGCYLPTMSRHSVVDKQKLESNCMGIQIELSYKVYIRFTPTL